MPKRSTRYYRKNEAEAMERIGLKPTINSGAGWIDKEDGKSDLFLSQLKSTDAQSISIKQNDIRTLEYNASVAHKVPVFAFQFLNTGEIWVAISEDEFKAYNAFKEQQRKADFEAEKSEKTIDKNNEKVYNKDSARDMEKAMLSYLARCRFNQQSEKEKEQRMKEQKQRIKERRRNRSGKGI